jgi:enamine deaminase RidA (YjgF/YER057c/UK114 family)
MGRIEDRLSELGLELPAPFAPPPGVEFPFDLVKVHGGLGYVSGHLPVDGAEVLVSGRVGDGLTVEQGYEAARLVGLSIFASLAATLGELDRVTGWVKALGLVQCAPGFDKPPAVINGFTDLVLEVWGPDAGRHARSAIGADQLPFDVPVEVEAVVEIS